jgi:hypothetical protein
MQERPERIEVHLLVADFLTIFGQILAIGGFLAVGWFIFPFGIRRISETRLARLCKAQKAIVLSYDDDPGPGEGMSHDDYVIGLTRQIIEFAEENGYRLLRLGDVLGKAQG